MSNAKGVNTLEVPDLRYRSGRGLMGDANVVNKDVAVLRANLNLGEDVNNSNAS